MSFPRAVLAVAVLTTSVTAAQAATLVMGFDNAFSGVGPSGAAPWLTATLTDVSAGVRLEVRADGLSSPEALRSVYLNLDPVMAPTSVTFTHESGRTASISRGVNAFKADGDGRYDFLLEFGTGAGAFQPGEHATFLLAGPSSLNTLSFDFLSQPAGGNGPFIGAAHVQGTGPSGADSVWVSGEFGGGGDGGPSEVPLPAGALLLLSGLFPLGAALRRQRQTAR